MAKLFIDSHFHLFNLSHPNLFALVNRLAPGLLDQLGGVVNKLSLVHLVNFLVPGLGAVITDAAGKKISAELRKELKKVKNLLSVMDNDIGASFLEIEDVDVAKLKDNTGALRIWTREYDRLVVAPLLMDFHYEDQPPDDEIYYFKRTRKPIGHQVHDTFTGIREYFEKRPQGKLAFYPFLGLNPLNFNSWITVQVLLDRLFEGFETAGGFEGRLSRIEQNLRTYDGAFDGLQGLYFGGIKVYPPLGFDPWPAKPAARTLMKSFYDYCQRRGIPLTTHCSHGGFKIISDEDAKRLTSPLAGWTSVLKAFPNLRLNFAHFGGELHKQTRPWMEGITKLCAAKPNVYADVSAICNTQADFAKLGKVLPKICDKHGLDLGKIHEKLLFGTDFMINLLDTDSYYRSLKEFIEAADLPVALRNKMCEDNPRRFLG